MFMEHEVYSFRLVHSHVLCFSGEIQICRCTTAAQGTLTLWRGDSSTTTWWSWSVNIPVRRCYGTRRRSAASLRCAVWSLYICCIYYLQLHF